MENNSLNSLDRATFLEGSITKALISFTFPVMLSLTLQALYGTVDLIIVGHFGTTASVAAVATGGQVMYCISTLIIGLTTGVTVMLGQKIGAKDAKGASSVVGGMMKLISIIVIFITFGCIVLAPYLARIMQMPDAAYDATVSYLRICGAGTMFVAGYNAMSAVFRGIGNSKSPLLFIAIACSTNIIGDLILVGLLQMDAVGAALATVIAQGISVLFSLLYVKKHPLPFIVNKEFKKGEMGRIIRIGGPIALQDFLTSFSFLIITSIVNSLGVIASASLGIAEKMFVFLALIPLSFLSSLAAFVAQNVGANQMDRAKKALHTAIKISFVAGCLIFTLVFFAGDKLAMIFESDEEVIKSTWDYFRGGSFEHFIIPFSFCLLGYYNGLGKTTFVMAQGLIAAFLVRIPLSYIFSQMEGANMFTIGLSIPISAAVGLILCLVYNVRVNSKMKLIDNKKENFHN